MQVCAAAAVDNVSPGSWAARVAFDTAQQRVRGQDAASASTRRQALEVLAGELREHRWVLANIGGNLNDIARHANSTHEVADIAVQARTIEAMVHRLVHASNELLDQVRRVLAH
jgi:hypothetical protein